MPNKSRFSHEWVDDILLTMLLLLYRDEIYSLQILLSRTQAGPGRTVKKEQEEISPNHVQRINLISVAKNPTQIFLLNRPPAGPPEKLVTLYDSLAAELREKLNGGGGKHAPLLLPPRDENVRWSREFHDFDVIFHDSSGLS